MTGFVEIISYENPVFRAYVFWSSILILKMLAMAYLTSRQRRAKKVCKATKLGHVDRPVSHVTHKHWGIIASNNALKSKIDNDS